MAATFTPQTLLTLLPLLILLSIPSSSAHNITRLLSQFSDFSTFNDLLNRTALNLEINRRATITVLALDNSAAAPLAGLPLDTLKNLLSVHVILDYYDETKLRLLRRRTATLTTLYQTTGRATNSMGFMNVTKLPSGAVGFGSSVPGAPLVATLVKPVGARPYNLSVIQVSGVVVPPGIDDEPVIARVRSPPLPANYFVAPPTPVEPPTAAGPAGNETVSEAPTTVEGEVPAKATDGPVSDSLAPLPAADTVKVADGDKVSGGERRGVVAAGLGVVMGAVGVLLAL